MLTKKDKEIIRLKAKEQMEIAKSPKNLDTVELWKRHNAFKGERPVIHLEIGTFEHEVIPQMLECETDEGREIERRIIKNYVNAKTLGDDLVVPDYFPIQWDSWFNLFGIKIKTTHAQDSSGSNLGHQFNYVISDLENDYGKFMQTDFGVDKEGTLKKKSYLEELFGDILPVKLVNGCLYAVPTQKLVHLMGMEKMFFSMYDYPELLKDVMNRIAEDYNGYHQYLVNNGFLLPTTSFESLGQGSMCFTNELPGNPVSTQDVWGFLDSQETVGVSSEMFEEFIFPCYKKIGDTFGLLSYGCCEAVDPVWKSISTFKNLRKISISPWADETFMAEKLQGRKVIYHRKPSPNFLGVGKTLDESGIREHITKTLMTAKNCKIEITQRDVYTINSDINKAKRYVDIIRECIQDVW